MDRMQVREIARKNPAVDERQLLDALGVVDNLHEAGVSDQGYRFDPPFGHSAGHERSIEKHRLSKTE